MYETDSAKGYNFKLQTNSQCFQSSQAVRYIQMDCLQVGKKIQKHPYQELLLHQRTEKEIYQTSLNLLQNIFVRLPESSAVKERTFRSKKDQLPFRAKSFTHDNSQIPKKKPFGRKTGKLQKATLSKWQGYETV